MTASPAPTNFVVLYKKEADEDDEDRWWLTSAGQPTGKNLLVTSGGSRYEWTVTVAAQEVGALRQVLLQCLPDAVDNEANDVLALLKLFAQRFHDKEGDPYRAIVDVLETAGIRHDITNGWE